MRKRSFIPVIRLRSSQARRVAWGALVLGAATAALAVSSSYAKPSSLSVDFGHSVASDPLVGKWDTGPIPAEKIRSALRAAGYSDARITKQFREFGIVKAQEFRLVFYREHGAPFQLGQGWDPSKQSRPSDGDHGPYKLLPDHRFVVSGVDPPTDKNRAVFSYAITGKTLRLRLVSLTEPGFSATAVAFDRMATRALVAFSYHKIS
jgi:hypothetical protein